MSLKLGKKQIAMCIISGVLTIGMVANIVLASTILPARSEDQAHLSSIPVGPLLYLPGAARQSASQVYGGKAISTLKRIAFTFDSGWIYEYTPALLDILHDAGIRATFFSRGKWAEANPDLIRRMVAEGHLIGNHSYTHPDMTKLSLIEMTKEIQLADAVLRELIGYKPWLYRPPYGACSPTVRKLLAEQGYTHSVMWTIDTTDWMGPGVQVIIDKVLKNAKDADIVLMHVGAPQTIQALPTIIAGLREKGYEFVLVDELVEPLATADGRVPYRLRADDTLSKVLEKFGITIEELLELNPCLLFK